MDKQNNIKNLNNNNQSTQIKLNDMRRMIIVDNKADEIAQKLTQYIRANK